MNSVSVENFQTKFRGEIIQPGDPSYDAARQVYNGMIDKRPQMIARCVDVADVMAALEFGRENNILTAVRGGGREAISFDCF